MGIENVSQCSNFKLNVNFIFLRVHFYFKEPTLVMAVTTLYKCVVMSRLHYKLGIISIVMRKVNVNAVLIPKCFLAATMLSRPYPTVVIILIIPDCWS